MKKNNWFNKKIEEVEKDLNTNLEKGLTTEEVKKRQEQYGYNQLKAKKKKPMIQRFLDQFKDFSIIVLIIAAIVSGAVGVAEGEGITDTIIILIVVIVNAIIGVTQESKAEKSLEALQKLTDHASKVIRNGEIIVVPAKELVPGDIIVLDTGDYVPADVRIIEAVNLKSQEASLTGESVPVEKNIEIIEDAEVGLGDRLNMLFSSSLITYGRGKGIVVETGMTTEVGKIAGMLELAEEQTTPLQEKLNKLGKTLGIVALAICVFIFIIGLIQGKEPIHMFMTAVSLAVAAIPEGLVAVSTIVLAIGVQKMVKKNAIVKRLPAVETLGSATVICSDKTGTLTQNKMTVEKIFINSQTKDLEEFKKDATNEDIKKLEVYSYSNGNVYCELAEINDLIKVEINSYWRNTGAEGWKCTDQNFCEMIFLCLQGLIDKHITQRHIQYNKTAERRIGFNRIRKVLDSDDSIKRCEEYYLYNIKNKLLMMCGEYHEYCLDEWDSEEERVMFCKQCEVSAFYEHISRMSEDKIRDLIHTINPNVLKKIDEMNWAEYCIIDRYKNPFFKGLRDINSTFEKDRDYISYVGKNKTLNLLTTVGNRDGSKKALMRACGEIVANPNLYEILMDVNCLISRDLETDSIYDGAGDFLKEFEIEEEHIYHCKNIKMEPLEDAIVDIDGGIEND